MSRIDPWFWRHAYMLEFIEKDSTGGNKVKDTFTFSLPPESEQITLSQRVNYTKTFGGVVVDDYGNDTYKISLTGTTGNGDLKTIFRGVNFPLVKSGEDELLYLLNLIEKYGKLSKIGNKCIYLYDLGKIDKSLIVQPNYWLVSIDSFKYSRDKSNPTFYKYYLEMTGFREVKKWNKWGNVQDVLLKALDVIRKGCQICNNVFATISTIVDLTLTLKKEIDEWQSIFTKYINYTQGLVNDIQSIPQYIAETSESLQEWGNIFGINNNANINDNDIASEISNASESILNLSINLTNKINEELEIMSEEQIETLKNTENIDSTDEFKSLIMSVSINTKLNAESLVANTKLLEKPSYYKGFVYYGKKHYLVTSTDTYESLSYKEYGTVDYADAIATFNNGKELIVGDVVEVPMFTQGKMIEGNNVIKSSEDMDELGRDILLTDDGDIKFDDYINDFETTSGIETVEQAILSRLTTEVGTKIRDTLYGIKAAIGGIEITKNYIYSSIYQTLQDEPRIDSIDSIEFKGNGNILNYSISYRIKNDIYEREIKGVI